MQRIFCAVVAVLLLIQPPTPRAVADEIPPEVAAYAQALAALRQHSPPTITVEVVFQTGLRARASLLTSASPTAGYLLESLAPAAYQAVEQQLPGFKLNLEEFVFVQPDPEFFLALAKQHGDQADRAFFQRYQAMFPDPSSWPLYHERQTDIGGCTKFGALALVRAYESWSIYQQAYPHRYSAPVAKLLNDLQNELLEGSCACGSKEETLLELQEFVRTFPQASLTPKVQQRLRAIELDQSGIRFHCLAN